MLLCIILFVLITAHFLTVPEILVFRFCPRSLLQSFDYSLIDKIPGQQTDRKTLLGELNWIFMAVTDTIAWNVLPQGIWRDIRFPVMLCSFYPCIFYWYWIRVNFQFPRSVSEIVQARCFSCQSVPQLFTCRKDYALCQLFTNFISTIALYSSAPYVVNFWNSFSVRLEML